MIQILKLRKFFTLCALLVGAVAVQAAAVPDDGKCPCDVSTVADGPGTGGGGGVTGLAFNAQTNAVRGSTVTSNTVTIGGLLGVSTPISIAGGTYKIGSGAYGSGPSMINDGDQLTVQVVASSLYNTTTSATVTISAPTPATAIFTVTSASVVSIPGFSFGEIDNVQPSSVQTSNTVTMSGLGVATAISIVGGKFSINGGAFSSASTTISDGQSLQLQITASSSNSMLSQAVVTVGGLSANFNVVTIPATGLPGTFTAPTTLPVTISGLGSQPPISDLSNGIGPNVATRTASMLSVALGMPLRYVSQSSQGTAMLTGYNGGNLAFMPISVQTDTRAAGVYPVGNGQYQVVVGNTVVVTGQAPSLVTTIAPALVHLDQLLALLPGATASLQANGVIVATYNGATYAVQPSPQVQIAPATGAASLIFGNDGLYRFTDAQGNVQVLYPAFAEVDTLRNTVVPSMFAGGSATIQLDGTARLGVNGQTYTMGPDIVLGGVPANHVGQSWWVEGASRYRMSNVSAPIANGTTQGFGIK